MKLLNYTLHGENCRTFPCSLFFFTSAHVHLALVAASISHFLTAAIKSLCSSSNKKMSPLFFYLSLQTSVALFLVEPRWSAAYFLFFLCLFLALYSKSVDMTVNLSSVLQKTRIQREFPLSVSVFIESSVVSASQGAGSYTISRQK